MNDVIKTASGKWPSILLSLGVSELAVSGKHGPCPMCGGKDRFRMIELDGSAGWICNQCGSGDGMNLAMEFLGLDFSAAAAKIKPLIFAADYSSSPKKPNQADVKRRTEQLMNMWRSAKGKEMVTGYLVSRGLPEESFRGADLRGAEIDYFNSEGKNLGKKPAMLARIISTKNRTACLHRTYVLEGGTDKKITKTVGPWTGGAIRIFSTKNEDTLIVAEGIETAIAARWLHHLKNKKFVPAWSTVSAGAMKKLAIPSNIKSVLIMSDNDRNYTGQAAAYDLANKLVIHNKVNVSVFVPPAPGTDWLDFLVSKNH